MGAGICYADNLSLKKTREWEGKSQALRRIVRKPLLFRSRSIGEKADTYYETSSVSTPVESSSEHPHSIESQRQLVTKSRGVEWMY